MRKQSDVRPPTWQSLSKSQRDYLIAIYQADQEAESAERSRWRSFGGGARPAEQWRWMPYATFLPGGPTAVKKHLSRTEQISEGSASTLKALEKRGLILVQHLSAKALRSRGIIAEWQGILEPDPIPVIRITPAGRKLVRQALGLQMIRRQVSGTLKAYHWRALVKAYAAREDNGVALENASYGGIGWSTWLRLREYTPAPLVQEYYEPSHANYYLQITAFGIAFYERAYTRYQALYPEIPAPAPPTLPDPFQPYCEVGQRRETCRACRGDYLVEIERVYQQTRNFSWCVQETAKRVPGVTGKGEQCDCQEGEIAEIDAPMLLLLDRLIAHGWQVCFQELAARAHFMFLLDHLVGGSLGSAQEPRERWFDAALVKEKVLPLLDGTDLEDACDLAKGTVRYFWNERRGRGSIYLQERSSGSLSMRPIALTRARTAG